MSWLQKYRLAYMLNSQIPNTQFRLSCRAFSSANNVNDETIDWNYYSNPSNFKEIVTNIVARKVPCDMKLVIDQLKQLNEVKDDVTKYNAILDAVKPALFWFPNKTHPSVVKNTSEQPVIIEKVGEKPPFTYYPSTFDNLSKRLNALRVKHLGHMSGNKSYYLKNDLARLEQSILRFSVSKLLDKGFTLMSVPDIISSDSIENCGMRTKSKHSQIYHLDSKWAPGMCLSGTSEMAIASYLANRTFSESDLPLKFCASSRCYRAEANKHQKEKGIFRVHHFNKVEMFGITANETSSESEDLLQEFVSIQKEIFSDLNLRFKILEMPSCDLGLPAYHKIDMEAWIPTQKLYGEISSASNCTDYQSRRLNIKYVTSTGQTKFCHTVNGTACAIPRLLITMFECLQNLHGTVNVPEPLQKYMKTSLIKDKFREVIVSTKPVL